ncbi:hypothetical protein BH24ACT15_BH24ACT15_38200 [soil metagenome]
MNQVIALLPSPLLGPAVWTPVERCFRDAGREVIGMDYLGDPPRSPRDVSEAFETGVPHNRHVILLPHSNAGLYVPQLIAQRQIVATVFIDAGLPPAAGTVPLAPPGLVDHLATLADDEGILPPWTQWFDEQEVAPLFPDAATRAKVEAEQHRLPLTYFQSMMDVPGGWIDHPAAYLGFGDTYAQEQQQANQWNWPVEVIGGHHLHMLVDPDLVTRHLIALIDGLLDQD